MLIAITLISTFIEEGDKKKSRSVTGAARVIQHDLTQCVGWISNAPSGANPFPKNHRQQLWRDNTQEHH
ncbi:hypothetical protein JS565_23225 [Salmonella enterica subsp. enterica serovar Senftenberg]|nr:hypothetical protein [Salmonella enterica subsp. enterica serovar Senftenberg]